jgi:hypothetical protein
VKGREVKKNANLAATPNAGATGQPDATGNDASEKIEGQKSYGQNWKFKPWVFATAKTLGIDRRDGEDDAAFRDRVYAAVQARVAKAAQENPDD